jgi:pyrophosphate--fructose-6-phosphate 1-phosphotransferase
LQVSKIETERLLIAMVEVQLRKRKLAGEYTGHFNPQPLFCGYEGRACCPSNFDANYCYALGHVAAILIQNGLTGYMAAVQELAQSVESWKLSGVPLVSMMVFEPRKEGLRAVISKALVDLKGKPFATFKEKRLKWAFDDEYCYPGPIQFFGPSELTEQITCTLALESKKTLV